MTPKFSECGSRYGGDFIDYLWKSGTENRIIESMKEAHAIAEGRR